MPDDTVTRRRLKCPACYGVAYEDEISNHGGKDGKQPLCSDCGLEMEEMCSEDHACSCIHPVSIGNEYCPKCGKPICPGCGSHDVVQISRVTGYLQDVSGWNAGKQQELKDRQRVNIVGSISS